MCRGFGKLTVVAWRMQRGRGGSPGALGEILWWSSWEDVGGLNKDGGSRTNDKSKGRTIRGNRTW